MTAPRLLFVLIALYAALALSLIRRFPPVSGDEVVRISMSRHWIQGEPARYPLYDDIFARSVYPLRDVIPEVSIVMYHAWLAAWTCFGPPNYLAGRYSALAAAIGVLLVFYVAGLHWGGPAMGLACAALTAFSPVFLFCSILARPESLLLLMTLAILLLIETLPDRWEWKPFLIGGLAMLQMSIHPNAFVMAAGLFVFYLYPLAGPTRWRAGGLFVAGAIAGALSAFVLMDAHRFWMGLHTIHAYLLRPPILITPRRPLQWLYENGVILWNGVTFYCNERLAPGWLWSVKLWWIAMGALMVMAYGTRRKPSEGFDPRRWMLALGAVFLSSVALIKPKEYLYASNFLPFLIPLAAAGLTCSSPVRWRAARIAAGSLVGISFMIFLNFCRVYIERVKSYKDIVSEVRAIVPNEPLKVVGPSVLWFSWDETRFRDGGAILLSYWYTGQKDVKAWLEPWRPDILIVDYAMQAVVGTPGSIQAHLTQSLGCPVDALGVVESPGAYGHWEIFRIHWR